MERRKTLPHKNLNGECSLSNSALNSIQNTEKYMQKLFFFFLKPLVES